jgi:hypothetical protein
MIQGRRHGILQLRVHPVRQLLFILWLLLLLLLMLLLRGIGLLLGFFWLCHVLMLLLVARRAATGARGWLLRRTRRGTASPASRHGFTMFRTWKLPLVMNSSMMSAMRREASGKKGWG